MRIRTIVAAAMFLTACGGGEVVPSQVITSVKWGPIQPTYNGLVRARAGGAFENLGGSYANTSGTYRDPLEDGNPAYSCTDFRFFRQPGTATSPYWVSEGQVCTPEIGSAEGDRKIENVNKKLRADSSQARGAVSACSQFGFPVPDPCAATLVGFSY